MFYEYILMSPEGWRIANGYADTMTAAETKSWDLLRDYDKYEVRIYRYASYYSDPVLVEVIG